MERIEPNLSGLDCPIYLSGHHGRLRSYGLTTRARAPKDRLARLLASIPVEVQREGLSLSSLQTSLRGRRRGNCHPGELGAALRASSAVAQTQADRTPTTIRSRSNKLYGKAKATPTGRRRGPAADGPVDVLRN